MIEAMEAREGKTRRALVLGGTGYVGREVVRKLVAEGVPTAFTYFRNQALAETLANETGAVAYQANFQDPQAIASLFGALSGAGFGVDILVHAAVVSRHGALSEITDEDEATMHAVNVSSVRRVMQAFSAQLGGSSADVVLLAALDGIAKIRANTAFAATQAARLGMTYALAKELGPRDVRINLVLVGALGGGIAADIEPERLAEYRRYSAKQRVGEALEVAAAVSRLVLSNRWMTGSVFPVTGGL